MGSGRFFVNIINILNIFAPMFFNQIDHIIKLFFKLVYFKYIYLCTWGCGLQPVVSLTGDSKNNSTKLRIMTSGLDETLSDVSVVLSLFTPGVQCLTGHEITFPLCEKRSSLHPDDSKPIRSQTVTLISVAVYYWTISLYVLICPLVAFSM